MLFWSDCYPEFAESLAQMTRERGCSRRQRDDGPENLVLRHLRALDERTERIEATLGQRVQVIGARWLPFRRSSPPPTALQLPRLARPNSLGAERRMR